MVVAHDDDETDDDGDLDIMECNWPALIAFRACSTQWRVVGLQFCLVFVGLDYAACDVVLRQIDTSVELLADIRVMEEAALEILNEAE
ncbi:DUF1799 domain-containing protein [Rhizobium sp. 9140]|uniref:DUF1799 domain-containing protein n=1 Tax=Rhizobium sp. 9140 TaxID=1761900 RepID=UPI000AF5F299|nr:DUF1799 domain-containing protein [Rhizobium sp. 9140]